MTSLKHCSICLISIVFAMHSYAQIDTTATTKVQIFTEEDNTYISELIGKVLLNMQLDPEALRKTQIITAYYGLKMAQIGDEEKITTPEIIGKFKDLITKQNEEMKEILAKEQYDEFYKVYDVLKWSVVKRLNQL